MSKLVGNLIFGQSGGPTSVINPVWQGFTKLLEYVFPKAMELQRIVEYLKRIFMTCPWISQDLTLKQHLLQH